MRLCIKYKKVPYMRGSYISGIMGKVYIYIHIYKIFGEFHAKRALLWRFSVAGNNKIQ